MFNKIVLLTIELVRWEDIILEIIRVQTVFCIQLRKILFFTILNTLSKQARWLRRYKIVGTRIHLRRIQTIDLDVFPIRFQNSIRSCGTYNSLKWFRHIKKPIYQDITVTCWSSLNEFPMHLMIPSMRCQLQRGKGWLVIYDGCRICIRQPHQTFS